MDFTELMYLKRFGSKGYIHKNSDVQRIQASLQTFPYQYTILLIIE